MVTNENLPPNVVKQLVKELKNFDESPPEGIKVVVNEDNFSTIYADIEGPAGTPYENGIFRMKLILSQDFPQSPPRGYFLTKIFHPNIATNGEICVNTLKKDWNSSLGFRHVLLVVRCLQIEPYLESALNEQAGKILLENYEEYARHASRKRTKLKFSMSTKALNTDQSNGTNLGQDQKNSAPVLPRASNVAPAMAKSAGGLELQLPINQPITEAGVGGSTAVVKLAKVQTDKKKTDDRKKSLQRL